MRVLSTFHRIALASILFTFTATVTAADIRPLAMTPEEGFINTPISQVVLDFSSEYIDIRFSERALLYYDPSETVDKEGIIYFGGDEIDQSKDMYSAEIDGTKVIFTPKETWNIPGKYTLMIPAGALIFTQENGKQVSNDRMVYIWKYGILPNPFTTPSTGDVDSLDTLTLQLPDGFSFSAGYPLMSKFLPYVYLSNSAGEMIEYVGKYNSVQNSGTWKGSNLIIYTDLSFAPEKGRYYLVRFLPGILFMKDDEETMTAAEASLEMTFLYHYIGMNTSVETIGEETAPVIYSIDGVRHEADDLDRLPHGLWIVNGKKIVL